MLTALSGFPAVASDISFLNTDRNVAELGIDGISSLLNTNNLSAKLDRTYEESRITVSQSGGPTEGPQHGYFAVPLLVFGLAGILIYFIKND
jgi:hypothetical protein